MARFCEICNQEINQERAEALPDTKLCIEHARQIEKYGGEFKLSATAETTSKVGSLKKNYGGINVSKSRNGKAVQKVLQDYLAKGQ
jgi:hypothetical protein